MRVRVALLAITLLVSSLPGFTWAQAALSETASTIETMFDAIDRNVAGLRLLQNQIEQAGALDVEALQYRLDGRSFILLADLNLLVDKVAALPRENDLRKNGEQLLSEKTTTVGVAVFKRLRELEELLVVGRTERDSLSGGARISMGLYIHSLEATRFRYYDALIENFESRKDLGLSSDELRAKLETVMVLHAEKLAGQVEFSSTGLSELKRQFKLDRTNADLESTLKSLSLQHAAYVFRLKKLAKLMRRMGVSSVEYKALLLKGSGEFSVAMLERGVLRRAVSDWLQTVKEATMTNAPDFIFKVVILFAILLIFKILARITRRVVERSFETSSLDLSVLLKDLLISGSGGAVMVLGILIALSQIGISLGPMLAGLGVAGLAIGFALQDTLGNFAAGAMILIYRPYDVDDYIEVSGASGLVKKMNLVSTTIATYDNQILVIPNSKVWGDVIKNVTAQKVRRVDMEFGIGYGDDVEHAERVLEDVVYSHDKVLKKPAAQIKIHTLGDSSVNFIVRPWTKTEDYWDVYWDLMREVKIRFDKEGISIPFPQRDVHIHSPTEND